MQMTATLLLIWWTLGAAGAVILWLDWHLDVEKSWPGCPTVRAIFGFVFGGCLGAFLLVVACLIGLITTLSRANVPRWWNMPICDLWRRS